MNPMYTETAQLVKDQTECELFQYNLVSHTAIVLVAHSILLQITKEEQRNCDGFLNAFVKREIIDENKMDLFHQMFDAVLETGEKKTGCFFMKTVYEGREWVRFTLIMTGSEKEAIGIFENITLQREASINYLHETQFYQALISEKDAYAHVDVTDDAITRIGGMWNLYNEVIHTKSYSDIIETFINRVVHPDDRKHYLEIMQRENFISSFQNGVDRLGCEFRRIVKQNKMVWMELGVHLLQDPLSYHILSLIYIKNIDAKKKQELSLLHVSERDHLTNIYNRRMAERSIRTYLQDAPEDDISAFIITDVDNFKYINDNYGHKMGDQVLIRIADILSDTFERDDIIGRFGGDEFILFLKKITTQENVRVYIDRLYEQLKQESDPKISCSMGIVLTGEGQSYEQLFRQADAALYAAKNNGKAGYVFHAQQDNKPFVALSRPAKEERQGLFLPKPKARQYKIIEDSSFSFDRFIAEQGDMAYLVDPDSYMLLCGNQAFYDRIGMTEVQCIGMKCYEAVQRRDTPCPFCGKANWTTDKFYLWRNVNTALEQEFLIKNKLVQWQGQEVLLALAIDISNNKSIVDSMDHGGIEDHSLLSGIQRMIEADDLYSAITSALETITTFFCAGVVHFWQKNEVDGVYECLYRWPKRDEKKQITELETVSQWIRMMKWGQPIMIESQETMLCYSYAMYQYMQKYRINNAKWIQIKNKGNEVGYISVENISSNFQNTAFLESFSVFIAVKMEKYLHPRHQ